MDNIDTNTNKLCTYISNLCIGKSYSYRGTECIMISVYPEVSEYMIKINIYTNTKYVFQYYINPFVMNNLIEFAIDSVNDSIGALLIKYRGRTNESFIDKHFLRIINKEVESC